MNESKTFDELQDHSLNDLVDQLKQVMVPVEPSAAFVRSLGQELIEVSRRGRRVSRQMRRGLLIGAAALGSAASVAGVVTLVVLRRRSHQAQPRPAA